MPTLSRAFRLVGGAVLAVVVAACGAPGAPSSSAPASAPGSEAPVQSAGPSDSAGASAGASLGVEARAFQTLADFLTQASEDLNRSLSGSPTNEDLRQAYTTYAALLERAADDIEGIDIPSEAQADGDAVRQKLDDLAGEFEQLAADPTVDWGPEVQAALGDLAAALGRLRAELGLPPAAM